MNDPKKSPKASKGFTAEERAAIRERAREQKAAAGAAEAEAEVLAKIAEMQGMPAYAKSGDVVCFFQPARKFKTRYATLGFSDKAILDEGDMWPVYYALTKMTNADEARVAALLKKAVGGVGARPEGPGA
jgi:hypothetical protein